MKPRVCIDIRLTQTGAKNTGIGVYARELVRAMQPLEHGLDLWYLVLSNYPLPDLGLPLDRLVRIWRPRKPERWHVFYDMLGLSEWLASKNFNLIHALSPGTIQQVGKMRLVVTVHDLIPLHFPADHVSSPDVRWLYRRQLHGIQRSGYVIADSNSTKQDLVKTLKIKSEKIRVIYLATNPSFHSIPIESVKSFRARVGLPEQYVLYLGGYSARKNVPLLMQAYQRLGKIRRGRKLVLAGSLTRVAKNELVKLVSQLDLESDILWLGHTREEDLVALYNGAELFVYPSLYEGFGLPVLEAMACGTPVVASRAGSLAEVAGDAALLIEPDDEAGLAYAMQQVIETPLVKVDLKQRGLGRAAAFSWERCAHETLAVYHKVLA